MRGRRLLGKEMELPANYEGVVVKDTGIVESLDRKTQDAVMGDAEENEEEEECRVLKEVGSFDRVMIWDHEKVVEGDDPFVKGLSEWIRFAEAV